MHCLLECEADGGLLTWRVLLGTTGVVAVMTIHAAWSRIPHRVCDIGMCSIILGDGDDDDGEVRRMA